MIQPTSLLAYDHIQKNLGEKQLKVYLCLEDLESANNSILAKKLGWPINRVTGRVKELRDAGVVVIDCMRECPITHRLTYFWKVSDIFVPQEMKKERKNENGGSYLII